jgi:hypothetical protein
MSPGIDTSFKGNLESAISKTNLVLTPDVVDEFSTLYSDPEKHAQLAKVLDTIGIDLNTLTPLPPAVETFEKENNSTSIEKRNTFVSEINSNLIEYTKGTRNDLEGIAINKNEFEQNVKALISTDEKYEEIKSDVGKLENSDTRRIIRDVMDLSENVESFGKIVKSELEASFNFKDGINFDIANYQLEQLDILAEPTNLMDSLNKILKSDDPQDIKIGLQDLKNQIINKIYVVNESVNANRGNALTFRDLFGSNSNIMIKGISALPNIAIDIDTIKYHPNALEDQFQIASKMSKIFNPMSEEFRKFQGKVDIPINKMVEKMGFIDERSFGLLTEINRLFSQLQ